MSNFDFWLNWLYTSWNLRTLALVFELKLWLKNDKRTIRETKKKNVGVQTGQSFKCD